MLQILDNLAEKWKDKAGVILRIGISSVFLYFGLNEVLNPGFGLAYIQPWAEKFIPMSLELFVLLFGIIHLVVAAMILFGFKTRPASLVAMFMLISIIVNLSFTPAFVLNELAVRDFAILMSIKVLFLIGPGKYSWDERSQR